MKFKNFALDVMVILGLKNTHPDSLVTESLKSLIGLKSVNISGSNH